MYLSLNHTLEVMKIRHTSKIVIINIISSCLRWVVTFPLFPAPNTYLTSTADDPHGYIWIPEYHTNHIIFSLQTETATDSIVGKVLLCPEYQNTENCYLIELGNTVTSIHRFSDSKGIGECQLIRLRFNHKSGSTLVQVMVFAYLVLSHYLK